MPIAQDAVFKSLKRKVGQAVGQFGLIEEGDRIAVAVSGGKDSLTLLHLLDALRRRDWHALFVAHRALWRDAEPQLLGHALVEQLARAPRKGLTAHLAIGDPSGWSAAEWASKPFLPLPVLGIPGWWPANEDPAFYADTRVFRSARA